MKGGKRLLALLLLVGGAVAGTTLLLKQRYFFVIASDVEPFRADIAKLNYSDFNISGAKLVLLDKASGEFRVEEPRTLFLSGAYIKNNKNENLSVNVTLKVYSADNFVISGIAYESSDGDCYKLSDLLSIESAKKDGKNLCVSTYTICTPSKDYCTLEKTYKIYANNDFKPLYFVYIPVIYNNTKRMTVETIIELA